MLLDISTSTPLANYKILSNSITPRPIAWISTKSNADIINLAPFSFFAPLCATPMIFGISIMNKSNGDMKDTLLNAKLTKKATICTVQPDFLESMQQTSTELPYNISEASTYKIPTIEIAKDYPPCVDGVKVAFFCDFKDVLQFSETCSTLILQAQKVFIDDELYSESLNFSLQNVGRCGKGFI